MAPPRVDAGGEAEGFVGKLMSISFKSILEGSATLIPMGTQVRYLTSVCLHFLICEMGTVKFFCEGYVISFT